MKLDNKVDKIELSKIIKSLIAFIVIDGKKFVKEENREAYIKKYLYKLSKSMNGKNSFVNISSIWKVIEKDITLLIQKEATN